MTSDNRQQTINDELRAFAFSRYPVRGAVTQLPHTWQELTARRAYPQPSERWLADMLTAVTLVRSGIKASGRLSLQIRSQDNPHLLSAECDERWRIRGMVRYADEQPLSGSLPAIREGLLTLQLEPPDQRVSYQGVVPLTGEHIAEAMQHYFQHSEQLRTCFVIGADGAEQIKRPWGLMLQRMPGGMDDDDWQRLCMLAGTLGRDRLHQAEPEALLKRLFPEDEIELFAPQAPHFHCACSRMRVSRMLLQLGEAEARDIVAEQGQVSVACEHCGEQYRFDSIDIEHLFTSRDVAAPLSDQVQ